MVSKKMQRLNKHSVVFDTSATVVVAIRKDGSRWNAYSKSGERFTNFISTGMRQKAFESKRALDRRFYKDGRPYWCLVPMMEFDRSVDRTPAVNVPVPVAVAAPVVSLASSKPNTITTDAMVMEYNGTYTPFVSQDEAVAFIHNSYAKKPRSVFIPSLQWKHLVRAIVRGKNTCVVGMQGCGKTLIARTAARVLGRPTFVFPLGEVSDPKSFLLGNSHFDPASGTVFYPSRFIRAIQTRGAVVILDELTRPHPDVQNILMSVLDSTMRYLILDESKESAVVPVADGVTFVATANIGNEFTATRILDRALTDRFTFIEMPVLTKEEETDLLKMMYPTVASVTLEGIADIATQTRNNVKSETPKLSTSISTRMSVEIAGLLYDGFTLAEAAEVCIYPFFPNEGGLESERVFVKQIVQGFVDNGAPASLFGSTDIDAAPTN